MVRIEFEEAIKAYEKKKRTQKYERTDTNNDEQTIINDSKRTMHGSPRTPYKKTSGSVKEEWIKDVKRYITQRLLIECPINYYQGFFEIAFHIVSFYFETPLNDIYENFVSVNKKMIYIASEDESCTEDEDGSIISNLKFIKTLEEDVFAFIDEELYKVVKIVIVNVYEERFLPMVENDFKLFFKYENNTFNMLKKRGYEINEKDKCSLMETALTFCCRTSESLDVIYDLLAIIISCPNNMAFILFVHFFEKIRNKENIEKVDDVLYDSLIWMESEFKESEVYKPAPRISKKSVLIGTGVAIAVAAVFIYKCFYSRNNSEEN